MIDLQRRRLAGAVAAEQRHHLALAHVEVDAVQDVRLAVPGVAARAPRAAARSVRRQRMACAHVGLDHLRVARHARRSRPRPGPRRAQHRDRVGRGRRPRSGCARPSARCGSRATLLDQRGDAVDVLVRPCPASARRAASSRDRARAWSRSRARACGRRAARPRRVSSNAAQADRVEQLARARRSSASSDALRAPEVERACRACAAARCARSRARVRCGNTAEIWNERTSPSARSPPASTPVMSLPL